MYTGVEVIKHVQEIRTTDRSKRHYECPICGFGKVHIDSAVFYGSCDECGATLIDFKPLPHQEDFLRNDSP